MQYMFIPWMRRMLWSFGRFLLIVLAVLEVENWHGAVPMVFYNLSKNQQLTPSHMPQSSSATQQLDCSQESDSHQVGWISSKTSRQRRATAECHGIEVYQSDRWSSIRWASWVGIFRGLGIFNQFLPDRRADDPAIFGRILRYFLPSLIPTSTKLASWPLDLEHLWWVDGSFMSFVVVWPETNCN